jgi:non-canonical purine NTP pyrophosphatase (RdgB/HAM1 family)
MKINSLYFATSNKDKVAEAKEILRVEIHQIYLDVPEIQGLDVKEVVKQKAIMGYKLTGKPVLVEDTGLYFVAWNDLPGALVKWFLKTIGNEGICRLMKTEANRRARAEVAIGMYDGQDVLTFSGDISGEVPLFPRGSSGFGWDPIFQPEGYLKTFGEMTSEEKNSVSMRRTALEKFRNFLESL